MLWWQPLLANSAMWETTVVRLTVILVPSHLFLSWLFRGKSVPYFFFSLKVPFPFFRIVMVVWQIRQMHFQKDSEKKCPPPILHGSCVSWVVNLVGLPNSFFFFIYIPSFVQINWSQSQTGHPLCQSGGIDSTWLFGDSFIFLPLNLKK